MGAQKSERVAIENVIRPGKTYVVDAGKYRAMRKAMLKVLPATAPGLTPDEVLDAVVAHLPDDLFPGGAKAGWWAKAVQLDLEAKKVIARGSSRPLRLHRTRAR